VLERVEEGVPEVSLVDGSSMAFDLFPEVFVRQLERAGEERQETPVDRSGEIVAERGDLIHERLGASGDLVRVLELLVVEVELADPVVLALLGLTRSQSRPPTFQAWTHSPAMRGFVAGVHAALGVPVQSVLVLLGDIAVEVLRNAELPVELKSCQPQFQSLDSGVT
jgi:hypothetical protein